jgi:phosphonate transport system substrate-binding protein
MRAITVGAVAYSANVVPIWEGMREYFAATSTPIDFILFSNYERQVDALMGGTVDIAWNTNLAYVRTVRQSGGACTALAMRDIDATFKTVFVGRQDSGLSGLEDLRGRRVALGSRDSGQARILPLKFLADAGIGASDVSLVMFDSDVGKHGDTGRSELDAMRAVFDDEADVAALGITTWQQLQQAGDVGLSPVWTSGDYSHCNFTTLGSLDAVHSDAWVANLMAMDWENPVHRPVLEMEGLREWVLPVMSGYDSLFEAVDEQEVPATWS